MANDYDTTARNALMDHFATLATRARIHDADPGGANGNTGQIAGSGDQPITWGAAAGGAIDANGAPAAAFPVPAGASVAWVSFWNTAGTVRYAKKQLAAPEVFTNAGTFNLDDADFDLNDA